MRITNLAILEIDRKHACGGASHRFAYILCSAPRADAVFDQIGSNFGCSQCIAAYKVVPKTKRHLATYIVDDLNRLWTLQGRVAGPRSDDAHMDAVPAKDGAVLIEVTVRKRDTGETQLIYIRSAFPDVDATVRKVCDDSTADCLAVESVPADSGLVWEEELHYVINEEGFVWTWERCLPITG